MSRFPDSEFFATPDEECGPWVSPDSLKDLPTEVETQLSLLARNGRVPIKAINRLKRTANGVEGNLGRRANVVILIDPCQITSALLIMLNIGVGLEEAETQEDQEVIDLKKTVESN